MKMLLLVMVNYSVLFCLFRMQYSTNLLSEDKSGCNTHQGRRGQFLKEKHKNIILHIMEWKTMEVINTCD